MRPAFKMPMDAPTSTTTATGFLTPKTPVRTWRAGLPVIRSAPAARSPTATATPSRTPKKVPAEAEVWNGVEDADGCPDVRGKPLVLLDSKGR